MSFIENRLLELEKYKDKKFEPGSAYEHFLKEKEKFWSGNDTLVQAYRNIANEMGLKIERKGRVHR